MKHYFVFFFCVICTLLSTGQTNPILASFSVRQINNSVKVSWTIKAGFSCTDVNIEHSLDSIFFSSVYTYPGICGAETKDQEYSFIHPNPSKNAKNYYRMDLGNYGYSEILQIHFSDYGDTGYIIAPNPLINSGKLIFNNPENAGFSFEVYDTRGILVFSREIVNDEIELSSDIFNGGIYLFRLYNNKESFKGSFMSYHRKF